MRKTLYDIAKKLKVKDDHWLLAGKTAAVLQGAMTHAHKLTLYTNQVTAYRFNEYFEEYRNLKVKYRSEDSLAGHAGTFDINSVEVSVVGDPEIIHQGKHYFLPVDLLFQQVEKHQLDDVEIYLLPPPWLILLGLLGNDMELAESLASIGKHQEEVLKCAQELGIAFYIKPLVDELYSK